MTAPRIVQAHESWSISLAEQRPGRFYTVSYFDVAWGWKLRWHKDRDLGHERDTLADFARSMRCQKRVAKRYFAIQGLHLAHNEQERQSAAFCRRWGPPGSWSHARRRRARAIYHAREALAVHATPGHTYLPGYEFVDLDTLDASDARSIEHIVSLNALSSHTVASATSHETLFGLASGEGPSHNAELLSALIAVASAPSELALIKAFEDGCNDMADVERHNGWSRGYAFVVKNRLLKKLGR